MKAVCTRCNGTGTEVVPRKGARPCACRRRRLHGKVIDLQAYRTAGMTPSGMDAILAQVRTFNREHEQQEESDRVRREVDGVMTFFKADAPDFITDAVVEALWEACALVGIESPTYEDDLETMRILTALFSKTKMLELHPARSWPVINSGDTSA